MRQSAHSHASRIPSFGRDGRREADRHRYGNPLVKKDNIDQYIDILKKFGAIK